MQSVVDSIKSRLEEAVESQEWAVIVQCCRDGLSELVRHIFTVRGEEISESASLLELLESSVMAAFVGDKEVIDSLHYVRILGINARHGLPIKRTAAKLALENFRGFLSFVQRKFAPGAGEVVYEKLPYFSEAATRRLYIDLYLREAGWEVLEQENVPVPGKAGVEIAVTGMPNSEGVGYCDYVLYGRDGKPLAVVEAKKASVSPEKGRQQVELYGRCLERQYGVKPVLYYTNGYSIQCLDGFYPDRGLLSFHTLAELEILVQRQNRKPITDQRIREDIANRHYQKMAITSICERLNRKFRRGLLVMATGTGKTRVSIALVDVLTRNRWVKNVLFLADRTSLVKQAYKNFSKLLPDQSFWVLSDSSLPQDPDARITFSTYQTMINYVDGEEKKFSSGRFDLIIIDEAHRSIFNKYGAIFEYFDSLLVGLTATPKSEVEANTYRIFNCESGEPNFDYGLKEAVHDHYLVPYKVVNRTTRILSRGIKYSELSPEEKRDIENAFAEEPPDMGYDVAQYDLFKKVYNEPTCDRVLQELMRDGLKVASGDKLGKTIIFAYNHKHAKMIVERFHALYPNLGPGFCKLVDNYVNYSQQLVEEFEHDQDFQIAVSVDMLDTGIDVPAVLNLVFFKPVKSRIKFIQMIGRGTRLCPEVFGPGRDKECFYIFDYCSNFAYFEEHPDSVEPQEVPSITQRLFKLRLGILVELQKIEHQEIEFNRNYYLKLRERLYKEVKEIRSHSCRLQVRMAMPYVDKYCNPEVWQALSPVNQQEIQVHLAPLLDADSKDSEFSKIFDARMLNIQLTLLVTSKIDKAGRDVKVIREACQFLLTKASVPQIMAKAKLLKTLVAEQFWMAPQLNELETAREELRELMKFLDKDGNKTVVIHIDDEVVDAGELNGELIDIRTYRQKVLDYLKEHSDMPVLHKISNLEQINTEDLKQLEHLLWHQLGTAEEYSKEVAQDNLAAFVRSLIGLDQDAVNRKFGDFLNGNELSAQQQEFVKAIIDYVRENGNITSNDLLVKTPFSNYDVSTLFGDKLPIIRHIINTVQQSVEAA